MLHSAQVNLGMPSTAVVNAQHASSALSNRVPFRCFFICEKRKMWQGQRSGEHGGCPRQQLHLRLVEKVHIWCWCVRAEALSEKATESRLWAVLAPNMADHRETAVHAPVPSDYMSVCPQRMVATWPDLPKETNSHFLVCC